VGRHRNDGDVAKVDTDSTEVMPTVPAEGARRSGMFTANPLLLAAGGVALLLVIVVGGWALASSHGEDDSLIYPWSSHSPGQIDVSIALQPTDQPSPSQLSLSPSAAASAVRTTPQPSRSAGQSAVAQSHATGVTARLAEIDGPSGGEYVIHFIVTNGSASAKGWRMEIDFRAPAKIDRPWNAIATASTGTHVVLTADQALEAGKKVEVGFTASYSGKTAALPVTCTIDGTEFSCSQA
jgi:hypothetical protein